MGTKVKGSIMKGFKYISNIFEDKEEEEEFQIGAPTDVKHVAHIGMDDTSATKPSWMEEYKAAPELAPQSNPSSEARSNSYDSQDDSKQKPPKDSKHTRRSRGSSDKNKDKESSSSSGHHRFRRRSKESNNLESTSEESSAAVVPKHSRKKKTKGSSSAAGGDGSTKSSKGDHSVSKSLPDSTLPAFPDNIAAGGSGSAHARRRGTKSNETPNTVLEVYD